MQIVSWNVERGYHPDGICSLLAGLEADVYLLTELDRGNRRTGGVDMFALLSERLGMPGRFAQEFEELESVWRRLIPKGGPGGGVHGNAVFSRLPILGYRELRLPTEIPLHWDGGTIVPELFEPRRGSRVAQLFELELEGRPVTFLNTHLENWRCGWPLRRRQLEAGLALLDAPSGEGRTAGACGGDGPVADGRERIVAGDFNCLGGILSTWAGGSPVNREVRLLRAFLAERGLRDPWLDTDYTSFNFRTRAKLDWLCLSAGLEVVEKRNLRTELSDHNCLSVRVRQPPPPPRPPRAGPGAGA